MVDDIIPVMQAAGESEVVLLPTNRKKAREKAASAKAELDVLRAKP